MATKKQILSLSRYFMWAGIMRDLMLRSFSRDDESNEGDLGVTTFAMMSYWFGSLHVVVEGWHELKLSDTNVDALLGDADKVKDLKWCRHAAFHYQKELYHDKFLRIMRGEQGSADWARDLHEAFG